VKLTGSRITSGFCGRARAALLPYFLSNMPWRFAFAATDCEPLSGDGTFVMSYTEDIARALIATLTRTADAPVHLLAGHVPNLPFWIGEVNHVLAVIAGYPERHEKMVAAENDFALLSAYASKRLATRDYLQGPPPMALKVGLRSQLSRELVQAAGHLIDRCVENELITSAYAGRLRKSIDLRNSAAR
jgi:hypothetical protein